MHPESFERLASQRISGLKGVPIVLVFVHKELCTFSHFVIRYEEVSIACQDFICPFMDFMVLLNSCGRQFCMSCSGCISVASNSEGKTADTLACV